jgi:hypothetical protein
MCGMCSSVGVSSFCCLIVMDKLIINSESATKIDDFAFTLYHFTQLRSTTRSERTLICFSNFKNISSDITNVFNEIIILHTITTMIQLDGS